MKKRSLKQIVNYKNCMAIIYNDIGGKGYKYQPTNDMVFYFDIMDLDSNEVDKYEITKIYVNKKQWLCLVNEELCETEIDHENLDTLICKYLNEEEK